MSQGSEEPDLALAREFKARPLGHHSPALQRLLRRFRGEPVEGKYALLRIRPEREWMIVQFTGVKGEPLILHPDKVFSDWNAAEWAVFKLRWKRHFGCDLPIE
jgi:hypothetical protein